MLCTVVCNKQSANNVSELMFCFNLINICMVNMDLKLNLKYVDYQSWTVTFVQILSRKRCVKVACR